MDAHLTGQHDRAMTTEAVHGTASADPAGTRISPHSRLIANSSATRQSGDTIVIAAQTVAVNHCQRLLSGTIARSRGAARPSCWLGSPSKGGGRRESRVLSKHPQPRAQTKKRTSVVATGSPKQSDLPCAMVYGLFRALLGDRGFLATVACGSLHRLDASVGASGPHGFAVRLKHRSAARSAWRKPSLARSSAHTKLSIARTGLSGPT
jgi:hypothetical protein